MCRWCAASGGAGGASHELARRSARDSRARAGSDRAGPPRSGGRPERRRQGHADRARAGDVPRRSSVVFPRRVVTRPASAAEDNDSFRMQAFDAASPTAPLRCGGRRTASIRRSRDRSTRHPRRTHRGLQCVAHHRRPARARYAHVTAVLITAPPEVLAARLARAAARATARSRSASVAPSMTRWFRMSSSTPSARSKPMRDACSMWCSGAPWSRS